MQPIFLVIFIKQFNSAFNHANSEFKKKLYSWKSTQQLRVALGLLYLPRGFRRSRVDGVVRGFAFPSTIPGVTCGLSGLVRSSALRGFSPRLVVIYLSKGITKLRYCMSQITIKVCAMGQGTSCTCVSQKAAPSPQ